jgi:hypothetical protein
MVKEHPAFTAPEKWGNKGLRYMDFLPNWL